jgi:hypothetical protein
VLLDTRAQSEGKDVPLLAWQYSPSGISRQWAQKGGKVVSPTHRSPLPQEISLVLVSVRGARGGAVVEALRYKFEGRGFDSRLCHWNFLLT